MEAHATPRLRGPLLDRTRMDIVWGRELSRDLKEKQWQKKPMGEKREIKKESK